MSSALSDTASTPLPACTACGHELEAVQSFSDDPLTTCPDCGGALRKLFGNVGVVFKGSGFYRNDSRSSGSGASTSGASERQGIVQRLDVGTSGVMVIAKSEYGYSVLKNAC